MLITAIVLLATFLVLVVLYVLDDALEALQERIGQQRKSGLSWSKRITWILLLIVVAQFFLPTDLLEPKAAAPEPLPQVATLTGDSLWSGADTSRLTFIGDAQEELIR